MATATSSSAPLIDALGRRISYLRISVTDRCDLRCRYCMAERMQFLPRDQVLSLEEIALLADLFIARGITKIRLTGGEPLVRRDIGELVRRIGRHLGSGLDELTLTTNATRLDSHAQDLFDAGVRRVNVSLDSRDPARFADVTRGGDIGRVFAGLDAARAAGLAVKINMVALKGINDDEILPMLRWCDSQGFDLSLIETMPLGDTGEDRTDHYLPLTQVIDDIAAEHPLAPITHRTGGPSRYHAVDGMRVRLGLITPLTRNFCADCNRIRMTCEGKIFMCLGHEDHVDFKAALREGGLDAVQPLVDRALRLKPAAHDFHIGANAPAATRRHMSVTGG
ncbi:MULTISPECIES: GTP 3',8-cyclase MoaA [Sphingobium]|jgi:GTP 3',8-cyclase|uniref:GTP 3',8-cyclase MoaA n=1 Tax=Sphingobium TaxID=165695 RepID=UPI000C4632D7|nr:MULTISPECIES: GTP 3',8-cyclase MoaA [Sphingobium]MAX15248.1 GTP 3',8-cyclase MoaA [Sphingobium sp.]MBA38174.1 GTP 3',8-cyclase MoaA [Sphingobium sp.]MBS47897.1 GTP 3',8-cyclase MoaA [Sphingobium sp.]MCC4255631.1 GTP 3',8-cyclase MoaA [Sphingobium lactosutens]